METQIQESSSGKTSWTITNNDDYKIIQDYFDSRPEVRIVHYANRYFLEMKKPNGMETYSSLDDCLVYRPMVDGYIKSNSYRFLWQAKLGYQMFKKKPKMYFIDAVSPQSYWIFPQRLYQYLFHILINETGIRKLLTAEHPTAKQPTSDHK